MKADRKDGMLSSELVILQSLIYEHQVRTVLEIGLANGASSLAILDAISKTPEGTLTSIDPYQKYSMKLENGNPIGYDSEGLKKIAVAGYEKIHTFIELPSYQALPELLTAGLEYDMILIDGYHSFDYTFVDYFYSDLLLKNKGLLLIHDTNLPSVYPVCSFIRKDKSYKQVGPDTMINLQSLFFKATRRLSYFISGEYQQFNDRRFKWGTLGAFQKISSQITSEHALSGLRSS